MNDILRPVRVVHVEDGSLGMDVSTALARRMLVVALDLGRTIQVTLDQQWRGISAECESRGVEHRPAGNDIFRLANIRNDRLEWLFGAGRHACEGQR